MKKRSYMDSVMKLNDFTRNKLKKKSVRGTSITDLINVKCLLAERGIDTREIQKGFYISWCMFSTYCYHNSKEMFRKIKLGCTH